ncbi:TRAP transporter large permease [Agrococcus carbonis]|uniref:TRAP transporter, DctM subunit n=1 Tax=Agrococcus carbonis TaxID=684552 RepID=A0A1H1PTI2_9MICO|nr:TRAP transporter large permease [Agrococcus carbonis]SDS14455.1 TRAP transporter, DctM subunit [Agrococcus carbonis]
MNADVIPITVGALTVLVALILMAQPIWVALAAAGGIGLLLLDGMDVAASAVGADAFNATASYALVIIPMFVLMGVLAGKAGLAEDLFTISERLTHRLPGGLGIATIVACGGFAAVTGSSSATVATVGRIAVDQMTSRGYKPNSAAALVALGGTLGVLIPPSIIIVVFASMTGLSVGKLLIACVIPAIITIIVYSVTVMIMYKRGKLTVPGFATESIPARLVERQLAASRSTALLTKPAKLEAPAVSRKHVVGSLYVAVIFLVAIGGMYAGLFTATESGAVAAFVALAILFIRVVPKGWRRTWTDVKDAVIDAGGLSAMIFALLAGGAIFAYFLVKTGLPNQLVRTITSSDLSPMVVVIISLVMMLILGCFLDSISIMVIVIPLLWPILDTMGVDGVWYCILVVKAIEIGLVTPPFGINVFVASGLRKDITPEGVFRAVLPMVLAEFVVIAILLLFPDLVTFLPNLSAVTE